MTHQLIHSTLEKGGETQATELLSKLAPAEAAKELAYRLYQISERKKPRRMPFLQHAGAIVAGHGKRRAPSSGQTHAGQPVFGGIVMALSNLEHVGKGLELLRQGLAPWVEREFVNAFSANSAQNALRYLPDDGVNSTKPIVEWDVAALLRLMWDASREVFGKILGRPSATMSANCREVRNRWAHQTPTECHGSRYRTRAGYL